MVRWERISNDALPLFLCQLEKIVEFPHFCGIIIVDFVSSHREGDLNGNVNGK